MKQVGIWVLLLIAVSSSCKKESNHEVISLQGKYQSGTTMMVKPPVMYVQNRQITDTGIIKVYLRNHNFLNSFFFGSVQSVSDTLLMIEFSDNRVVKYKANTFQNYRQGKKVDTASFFIIQGTDSILFQFSSSYPSRPTRCDTVSNLSGGIVLPDNRSIAPAGTIGTYALFVHFDRFPLIYQNREPALPLLSAAYNTSFDYGSSQGTCGGATKDLWNIKNENIESRLTFADTIVLQEKSVVLNKLP